MKEAGKEYYMTHHNFERSSTGNSDGSSDCSFLSNATKGVRARKEEIGLTLFCSCESFFVSCTKMSFQDFQKKLERHWAKVDLQ